MNFDKENYPSAVYRVTAKAVIKNAAGKILACKDHDETEFELPGGGIEVGETVEQALARELAEEVGFAGNFSMEFMYVRTNYKNGMWRMAITFFVKILPENMKFEKGGEISEMEFIEPELLSKELYSKAEIARMKKVKLK